MRRAASAAVDGTRRAPRAKLPGRTPFVKTARAAIDSRRAPGSLLRDLGRPPRPRVARDVERALLGFLRALPGRAGSLLINGDLFEFWFEWRTVVPRSGVRVLAALMDLRDAGIPMTMIAGNHDCWGGDVLRDAGVDFHVGPWDGDAGRLERARGARRRAARPRRTAAIARCAVSCATRSRSARTGCCIPTSATRLALGSSQTQPQLPAARRGARAARGGRGDAGGATRRSSCSSTGTRTSPRWSGRPTGNVYANAGQLARRADVPARDARAHRAAASGHGSAEGPDLDALDRVAEEALP